MWKIISLSVLLTVAQAADINDMYGDWIEVAFYPVSTYAPDCIRFEFAKSTDDLQCTYADGRNATSVQVSMMTEKRELIHKYTMPIMVVDTPEEVMPTLNSSVKCDKDFHNKAVAKLVNEDYFILYQDIPEYMAYTRTEIEQNMAVLFARNVVSSVELYTATMSMEDLKNRRGAQMCVTENYNRFKSSENEVGSE